MLWVLQVDQPSQLAVTSLACQTCASPQHLSGPANCWDAGREGGREGGESVWWGLSPVWALSYFTTLSTLNTKTYPADSAVIITIVGCSLYVVQYAGLHNSLYLIYNKQTIKQTQLCQSVVRSVQCVLFRNLIFFRHRDGSQEPWAGERDPAGIGYVTLY